MSNVGRSAVDFRGLQLARLVSEKIRGDKSLLGRGHPIGIDSCSLSSLNTIMLAVVGWFDSRTRETPRCIFRTLHDFSPSIAFQLLKKTTFELHAAMPLCVGLQRLS